MGRRRTIRRTRRRLEGVAAAAAVALAALGCGELKTPTEPAGPPEERVAAFSFAEVQSRVFSPTCALGGCHDAATASGGMVLEPGRAYGEIVDRRAVGRADLDRVEPGQPERSYLIKKLRGDPDIAGEPMPLGGPPLGAAELAGIAGWIEAGAPAE
jgi:hypothetical protein